MKVTAKLNYLRIAPRKVRSVVGTVKKLSPEEALFQLKYLPNRASRPLGKLLKSAIANATNNFSLDEGDLKISEFKVDGGPSYKRFRPNSRSRVSPIEKKTSHITLVLEGTRIHDKKNKDVATKEKEYTPKPQEPSKSGRDFNKKSGHKNSSGFVRRFFQRKAV